MESHSSKSYIMTFYTTTHTMQTYKQIKERMDVEIMPVPREISASCGMAIRLLGEDDRAFQAFFDGLQIPCRLFCLNRGDASLIAEHTQD